MGTPRVVIHPQAARMRSSYLLSGFVAGIAIYAGILVSLSDDESVNDLIVLGLLVPAVLVALVVGNGVWKRIWRSAECPDCHEHLRLRVADTEEGSRWGYTCGKCETFYDTGVMERRSAP